MENRSSRNYGYVHGQNRKQESRRPEPPRRKKPDPQFGLVLKKLFRALLFILSIPLLLWKKLSPNVKASGAKLLFRIIALGAVVGVVAFVGLFIWASKSLPDTDGLVDRKVNESTIIYDNTGEEVLYNIFVDEKRTLVPIEEIPQHLIDGLVATEDTAFYEHNGVRPFSIARSFATGRKGGGASTLTQQLVKNVFLSPEQTITRKAKEFILAIRLEQKFTKQQILQIYFNEISYGSTNYGVESASQSYFGKSVRDLSLAESAVLAGMPKQPSRYLNNRELLKTRRDFVLLRMQQEGYITEEEKIAAQAEELVMKEQINNLQAPHFSLYVRTLLVDMFDEKTVAQGGLNVITSLDWDKQQAAEEAVEQQSAENFEAAGANNTALLSLDPNTGHILAMVGSRDYFDPDIDGQFNVAVDGRRQPGSSFKPIVYAAAFERGFTPQTVLYDVLTNFAPNTPQGYSPKNYDLQERGPVTIRKALQTSMNIPAVKAMYLVGEKETKEFAKKLGYSTIEDVDAGLSLVLGGGSVSLMDHASAYGVFANGGKHVEPVAILKVTDNNGDVLYEWKQKNQERVIEKDLATTVSQVLSDDSARASAFGANGILTIPGRPVAAKTGTTNSYVDAWTVGYTPSLVTAVWAGNSNNSPMTRGFGGSRVAAPIWNQYMRTALADTPVEAFDPMPEIKTDKAVLNGGEGGAITLKVNRVTGKIANSSTPDKLVVERSYLQPHSILHYVDKTDPQGPVPENPGNDPQYQTWEDAIQDWIRRRQEENPDWEVSFEDPPAEVDDEYSLELIPTLEVVYPTPSSTVPANNFNTDIRVSAPRGVKWVKYRFNGKYIGIEYNHPFNFNGNLTGAVDGVNEFTIIVEDDIGNVLEETIPLFIDNAAVAPEQPNPESSSSSDSTLLDVLGL